MSWRWKSIYIWSAGLFGLHLAGFFWPSSDNWGFHILGFLPSSAFIAYVSSVLLGAGIILGGYSEGFFTKLARLTSNPTAWSLIAILGLYLCVAIYFRVGAPLLGDSFTFIANFTDYFSGTATLSPWHEPLSMQFYAAMLRLFGNADLGELYRSFFITNLVLGAGFILVTFKTIQCVISDPMERLCAFLFLITLPYMVFHFGYVEIYSFTLFLVAAYVYLGVLTLQDRFPFYLLAVFCLILIFANYLNGFLLSSTIFVAFIEFRKGRFNQVLIGVAACFLILAGILVTVDFEIGLLMDQSPISHFLSFSEDVSIFNSYSQAFTVFSLPHLVETANYVIFMFPFGFVILTTTLLTSPREFVSDPVRLFLTISTVCFSIVLGVIKIQQGMANDWDVLAPYVYVCNFLAVLIFTTVPPGKFRMLMPLMLLLSTAHSALWFQLNTDPERGIRRIQVFFNPKLISQLGHYTISLHLSRYFDSTGDSTHQPAIWNRYSTLYPDDPRGYGNQISYLKRASPPADSLVVATYEKWRRQDPANRTLRREFVDYLTGAGTRAYSGAHLNDALGYYRRALLMEMGSAALRNNLGSVFAEQGRLDSAVAYFHSAIEIDPGFTDAYYNLGMVFLERKDSLKAAGWLHQAARLGSAKAIDYLGHLRKP